jgi:hypothetical protein
MIFVPPLAIGKLRNGGVLLTPLRNGQCRCAAGFALLNLPKGKSLGRSKPATSSYAQALQHTVWDSYYIQALLNCLMRNKISTTNVSELGYLFHD